MSAKLYAVIGPVRSDEDFYGYVMDEDGEVLYSHISSSRGWAKVDLAGGVRRLLDLPERFPDGYELVFLAHRNEAPQRTQDGLAAWEARRS